MLKIKDMFKLKPGSSQGTKDSEEQSQTKVISTSLAKNLADLQREFELCFDVVFREFYINIEPPLKAAVVYIKGLNDLGSSNRFLLDAIMIDAPQAAPLIKPAGKDPVQFILKRMLPTTNVRTTSDFLQVLNHILEGQLAIFIDGSASALVVEVSESEGRSVEEPVVEPSVRGPRDGFVEDVGTNMVLLRKRIKTSQFKAESIQVGKLTKTTVVVAYIKGIVNQKVVDEVKTRLNRIDIDACQGSGDIEEYIEESAFTIFSTVQNTERPDRVAGGLYEGRVAILIDTTPMALVVPSTVVTMLQAGEDYHHRSIFTTFVRLLRFIALNISLLLPGAYVALISFHRELLPTPLLSSLAAQRAGVPFPVFVEVTGMEITFELLREAGVRLPRTIGQAISTVGGLVIGDAAVSAGLVSPAVVIIVALTAVATFTIPSYEAGISLRILRFTFIILGATFGLPGIMCGLMIVLAHLCSLRSFGVPYLSPIAPLSIRDLKDTFVRVPWWLMVTRPRLYGPAKPTRRRRGGPQKPGGEGGGNG